MEVKKGVFYGVGVGPGDPELVTRQGCRLLEQCPVIAAAQTASGQTLALDIAAQAVDLSRKELLLLSFSMVRDPAVRERSYQTAAEQVIRRLERGQDVAMAVLGDVSIFATFSYLMEPVRQAGYQVALSPGVTSFSAAAARLGRSLTAMNEPLTIIPAGGMELDRALSLPGTKVLMKSIGKTDQVRQALQERGLLEQTGVVVNCGLPGERVLERWDEGESLDSYFTTIIVGEKED